MVQKSVCTGKERKVKEVVEPLTNSGEHNQLKENIKPTSLVSRLFNWHGQLCASRPWEVIFLTFTLIVCLLSLTYFQPKKDGFEEYTSLKGSLLDTIILSIARCVALVYTYVQFTRLRRLGCKYLLAIASLFTIIFSFGFSVVVITFFDTAFKELNEALPFFFLFVDIPKACTLAKFALSSDDPAEVVSNIGRGMALLAPSLTLDSVTMALVIGLGMLSGIPILSSISCFSCLSILANYLAFVSFYPACLALMIELIRDNKQTFQAYQLARLWQDDGKDKPNLVLQKVKVIMSAALVFFHLHTAYTGFQASSSSSTPFNKAPNHLMTRVSSQQHTTMGDQNGLIRDYKLDTILTAVLAGFLIIKYICIDSNNNNNRTTATSTNNNNNNRKTKGILKFIKSVSFMEEYIDGGAIKNQPNPTSDGPLSARASVDEGSSGSCPFNSSAKAHKGGMKSGGGGRSDNEGMEGFDAAPCGVAGPLKQISKDPFVEDNSVINVTPAFKSLSKFTIGSVDDDDDDDDGGSSNDGESGNKGHNVNQRTKSLVDSSVQTDYLNGSELYEPIRVLQSVTCDQGEPIRSLEECVELLKDVGGPEKLSDSEVMQLVASKKLPAYRLETALDDFQRGVNIRRRIISKQLMDKDSILNIPYTNYDYKYVHGACCENVIGYLPIPVGVAGPLLVDGIRYHVPMATTEGCLVASANRGCRALLVGGGVKTSLLEDGMTRAPLVRFSSAMRASDAKRWMEAHFELIAEAFNSTSRFARLKSLKIKQTSRNLYIRFVAFTGDAMGMNMLSKGSEKALLVLQEEHFPDMVILSLSSNYCTDKKPNAINWIEGRGKSVVCEAVVPGKVVREVLKTTVGALVDLNIHKNLIGSSLAGSIGGSNAHAANIVTAIFIATGQDPAQNVCSSNCITIMEPYYEEEEEEEEESSGDNVGSRVDGGMDVNADVSVPVNRINNVGNNGTYDLSCLKSSGGRRKEVGLYISCNMPSVEVGTVGGGTILPPQAACLEMLGVRGAHKERPGENAIRLAKVICSMVLAGELSLMSSLASGDLVKSHLTHNRSSLNMGQPPQCIPI